MESVFNEFSASPKGECRKMSAELNSTIDARSSSSCADAHALEPVAGSMSEVLATQILLKVGSVCGSNAAESAASMAGLSFPSSGGEICSGSRARPVTGAMSWVWSDDIFKSCSSRWQGAAAVGSNPSKIKSPRISAT